MALASPLARRCEISALSWDRCQHLPLYRLQR